MGGFELVRPDRGRRHVQAIRQQENEQAPRFQQSMTAAAEVLLEQQHPDGYWCGELTADSTLESDYLLLQLWLHPPQGRFWNPPTKRRIEKACRAISARQQPDGGWNIYPGGPSELNATIRAYTALKLGGYDPYSPAMTRAKERVIALGGLQSANSYTKINLSLFGLYPR